MKRITQTITGRGEDAYAQGLEPGDCMRAAVASIFELPLHTVPHFVDTGPRRPGNERLWLYAWHGWALQHGCIIYHLNVFRAEHLSVPGYSLLGGPSPRATPGQPLRHVCVGWQGQIVWDPHPSRDGLAATDECDLLVPITEYAALLLAREP